jgi:ABC-type lipoprotein release transport system permease subunit
LQAFAEPASADACATGSLLTSHPARRLKDRRHYPGESFLSGKLLANQLYGVASFNLVIFTLAVAVLAVCALMASILPARRAAGIDPIKALRTE